MYLVKFNLKLLETQNYIPKNLLCWIQTNGIAEEGRTSKLLMTKLVILIHSNISLNRQLTLKPQFKQTLIL